MGVPGGGDANWWRGGRREGEGEEGERARSGCEVIRGVLERMDDKGGGEKRDEGSPGGESSLSEGDEEFMRKLMEGSASG